MEDVTQPNAKLDALIVEALASIFDLLRAIPPSAEVRESLARARSFAQAVQQWPAIPPTAGQLHAMFDVVMDLHVRVVALARS
jgi:hypothetical protein